MKSLISYFIRHPKMSSILMMLVFVFGAIALQNINSSTFPKIDPKAITITATYPGASPIEVEESIIFKIENELQGIQGIRKITSTSSENSGNVLLTIEEKFNTDQILLKVKNVVDGISTFPAGMEKILVSKRNFEEEAVTITLVGQISLENLLKEARWLENELLSYEGISKISFDGLPQPEIEIALNEDALRRYQLTFQEVAQKIRAGNLDLTGGMIRGESELLMIRTKQRKYFAEELEYIPIRNSDNGGIIYLKDIAQLNESWRETPNASYINGERAVSLRIINNEFEDIENTAKITKAFIKNYNQKHQDRQLILLYDNAEEITSMKNILATSGLQGFVLVLLFLTLFLNHRLSFWVALGIPISFAGTFIIMSMTGITFNNVSLFGMIIVLGILVDDAVVIAENIYTHSRLGKPPIQAAVDGTMEILPVVYTGVLTTIIAFTFFFFVEGMMGQLFSVMATVIISALAFSLFEGTFILPGHLADSQSLKKGASISFFEKYSSRFFEFIREKIFMPLLQFSLKNTLIPVSVFIGLFMITLGGMEAGIIRQGDVDSEDSNDFTIELEMPPGTPAAITTEYLQKIEKGIWAIAKKYDAERTDSLPTVRYVLRTISADNVGSLRGVLQTAAYRDFKSYHFAQAVQEHIGAIPYAQRLNFVQENFQGKPISIELTSQNIEALNAAGEELEIALKKIPELTNVINNKKVGLREIEITLKDRAYAMGITLNEVISAVRNGFWGNEAMRFNRGKEEVRLMLRYPKEERVSISQMEAMRIRLADGKEIPLSEIAQFQYKRNLVEIAHYKGKRSLLLEADVRDNKVNLTFIKNNINEHILPKIKQKHPDLSVNESGQTERQALVMGSIKKVGPIFLILLLVIILFTFRSKMQTILVFILVPFSFIGVAWGHAIHDIAIEMFSILGMVALLGVMVNNAIILIAMYNLFLKKGHSVFDALIEAGRSRFRPILLTTLTTVSGLFPLIFSEAAAAEMVIPMAISVAYGLIIAMVLSLVILPIFLLWANRLRYYFNWIKDFEKPMSFEIVEPVVEELKHIHSF
jgi:multidrug efflux pump subunit AcrB